MDALVVRKSQFTDSLGGKYFNTKRSAAGAYVYVWFTRSNAVILFYSNETENDIFLEDYFSDIDNPTEIELSLLELAHNIKYIKD